MAELHARIGENIDLTMLKDDRPVVIEQLASNEQIRIVSYVHVEDHQIVAVLRSDKDAAALPVIGDADCVLRPDDPRHTRRRIGGEADFRNLVGCAANGEQPPAAPSARPITEKSPLLRGDRDHRHPREALGIRDMDFMGGRGPNMTVGNRSKTRSFCKIF